MRFRRGKRFHKLRELVRPPFAERMKKLKPQPLKPAWWAVMVGLIALCGATIAWALS